MKKKRIAVSREKLDKIKAGVLSAIIVNENDEMIVNCEIEIVEDGFADDDLEKQGVVCSINYLSVDAKEIGLKKGFTLLCVSVIRSL